MLDESNGKSYASAIINDYRQSCQNFTPVSSKSVVAGVTKAGGQSG